MADQASHWTELMRAANGGDASAYGRVLTGLAPVLRGLGLPEEVLDKVYFQNAKRLLGTT